MVVVPGYGETGADEVTKTFCDSCGAELVTTEANAVTWRIAKATVGVVFKIQAGWNKLGKGDVCDACVLNAIAEMAGQERERG